MGVASEPGRGTGITVSISVGGSAAALTPDAQIVTLRRGQRGWAEHLHKGRRDEVALATRRASGLGASRGVLAAEGAHVVMR